MYYAILGMVAVYGVVFFPYAYFRHDDWLILGNAALKVPEDWSNLWKATLFYGNLEVGWFFRPFFKGLTYIFFEAFHFNYYLWLTALLLCLVVAIVFAAKTIEKLTGEKNRALLFAIAFCGSWYIHFGSVVWMGEGMMNIPQMTLLVLCTYFFVEKRFWAAMLTYVLAIGFKESAVAHPAWLFLLLFCEKYFDSVTLKKKVLWLAPYFFVTLAYLIYRFSLHIAPASYHDYFSWLSLFKALCFFIGPLVLLWAMVRPQAPRPRSIFYAGFFLLTTLPYLGHGFFSPGWILIPGFYGCWAFCLAFPPNPISFKRLAVTLNVLAFAAILFHLNKLGWWGWAEGGKTLHTVMEEAVESPRPYWTFFDCPGQDFPEMKLERVVTFEAGMEMMWRLHHKTSGIFRIERCETMAHLFRPGRAKRFFWYQFPHLKEIIPAKELNSLRTASTQ